MVGIVILNYNSWEDTKKCIDSIEETEKRVSYCIYLVDNASSKPMPKELLPYLKKENIIFIQSDKNRGYSAGNNIGINQALEDGCEAILISNSDVRYESNSIGKLYQYLKSHPDVGIVGPKIILGDGSLQRECMCRKTGIREKYLLRTRFHIFFPKYNRKYWGRQHDYHKETFSVYAVLGCCFMISSACAKEVTPLDENPFLYEEELILGIKMEEAQWKTVYFPESVIQHLHGQSTKHVKAFAYTCNIVSEIYYCRTYLKMKKWQIWPLYLYRTMLYLGRAAMYKEFKKGLKSYFKETRKELNKSRHLRR